MKLDFHSIFNAFIAANKKEWAHDRGLTVGASEVFGCLRQTWFKKRGEEFGFEKDDDDDSSWGAAKRGDILEEHFVVPAIRDHIPGRAKLLFAGKGQQTLFKNHNSATPDGLIIGLERDALAGYGIADIGTDCVVLEIKSIDPRVNLREEKAIHHGQTQVQMGMIREQTEHKPNFAVILYVDASFLDDIDVFVVPFDEGQWKAAQDRAATVFEINDPVEITPEGKIDGGCAFCQFHGACSSVTIGAMPAKENKVDEAIRQAAYELVLKRQEITDQIKSLKVDLEERNWEIKEFLREHDTKKVGEKGKWSVSHYAQKGRKGMNTKALVEVAVEAGIDVSQFETTGEPFDVLRVSFSGSPDE